MEPFVLFDCGLSRRAVGRVCSNLRELLEAIRSAPDGVLEHHLMRCALEDYFELYEFPNDLARWCWEDLGDAVIGEQLGLVDPYGYPSISELRVDLQNILEDRLWSMDRVPWCRPGMELHLAESTLIAFDTGERFSTPATLCEALERISTRSIYYHVHEARRRTRNATDDFSAWLESGGANPSLITRLRSIDFYFLNLNQLRREILHIFEQTLAEASVYGEVR
jgi:hypothetical protein